MSVGPLIIGNHVVPQREVLTDQGRVWVPRYIHRRTDRDAWDIKIDRKDETFLTRYIPDSDYHGDSEASLQIAIEKLYDVLPNYVTFHRLRPGTSKYYCVREQHFKKSNVIATRVQTYICCFQRTLRTVSFYVGTQNTKTEERMKQAIDRAIGARCWSMDTIRSEGRDVLFDLPLPSKIERFAY